MEVSVFFVYVVIGYILYRIIEHWLRKQWLDNYGDKYILITGCDTGFGHELSKRLDRMGCHVFAACLTEKGEDELRKSCSERLVTVAMNVADHDSVVRAYDQVKSRLPSGKGLWGVVNNAGVAGHGGPVEWLALDDYRAVLDVNTLGMVDVATVFLPLVKKERGRIVNMTSLAGRVGAEGMAPYCISKFAGEAFSDSLRRQMSMFGVSVHIIEPGFHKTNIVNTEARQNDIKGLFNRAPKEVQEEYGEEYLNKIVKRMEKTFSRFTLDITPVIDAYTHALLGAYPKHRYPVGFDANYIVLPLMMLPSEISDKIMNLVMSFGKPIPKALRK